jgi:glycosyltransferase involved in cell wall biosynthesis
MPTSPEILSASPLWKYVLYDIEMADAVLVNSRFVKDTFQSVSHNHSSVHVIYLGVDDSFLALVPKREKTENEFHMLFAGVFEKRKGAETLIDGLERLDGIPWQLEIAGPLDRGIVNRNPGFFSNQRVKCLGLLSRQDLAQAMSRADVFVFPSLAEGSARVVFEALACGCYVITTPNSGSIVEDGMHGGIVPPGDSVSLAAAIEFAYQHRDGVSDIGRSNALCVTAKYRQSDYGDQLSDLYRQLLGES